MSTVKKTTEKKPLPPLVELEKKFNTLVNEFEEFKKETSSHIKNLSDLLSRANQSIDIVNSKVSDLSELVGEHPTTDGTKATFAFSPHQNMIFFRGILSKPQLHQQILNHPEFKFFQANICYVEE